MNQTVKLPELGNKYESITKQLGSFLGEKLPDSSNWNNIPGQLVKIAVSPSGFTWGINAQNDIFMCKHPCNRNWVRYTPNYSVSRTTHMGSIAMDDGNQRLTSLFGTGYTDIACDDRTVYLLGFWTRAQTPTIMYRPINGSGGRWTWSGLTLTSRDRPSGYVNKAFDSIFTTPDSLYGVATHGSSKILFKIPNVFVEKITNMTVADRKLNSNGFVVSDDNKFFKQSIVDGKKTVVSQERNGNNVKELRAFRNMNITDLAIDKQTKTIYAIDDAGLSSCNSNDCSTLARISTSGFKPRDIDVHGGSIWMVSENHGPFGNIFQRLDTPPNIAEIFAGVNPIDTERAQIRDAVNDMHNSQTIRLKSEMVMQNALGSFKEAVNMSSKMKGTQGEADRIRAEIRNYRVLKNTYLSKLYPAQILAFSLVICAVVAAITVPFLPFNFVKILIGMLLTIGLGAAIYFSLTNNTDGKSIIQSFLPSPK